ncbi:glycosyltransferase family 4 protein [Nostocaceae cyanobacterium CENA357]|uniref:Glycosyltransferase family 4 protein n=1 Tax=Atlanticothrix silvestris CENA357 TaxID=1725252 RepID=A0A8J7L5E3_9CYAN|nr:glycosyltransferase family 4 protein [Atlanticothrix silvestris]MBH8555954.1 glycosyltransferase family 4 protein [Atlanticothrix silvestris CENA357]
MKLCIVTHKVQKGDGQGRVNYEVAQEAIRRGHHLTLIASNVAPELEQNSQMNWIKIPVQGYPTEFIRNFVFAQKSTNWLHQHCSEFDLVKVNGAITTVAADVNAVHFVHSSWLRCLTTSRFTSTPAHISHLHREVYGFYQWIYTVLNAHWEKRAFQKAKIVVAVSEKVAEELVNIGVPRSGIRVIVNGVDLQEFTPGLADRQKLGLPEDVTLALFAGDIRTPRKNLDTVLHALAKVPHLHLAVVGSTEDSTFPQLAASLGLSDRVHFLGYRRDIAEIMRASDLFVFPSRYEPFGLVVIEAMASGLPVITATTTGAADIVTPACGIVLPDCNNVDTLAQALKLLNSDRSLMQQMGKAARLVAEQYSWKTMAQTYMDLFEELIKHEKHCANTNLSPSSRSITLPFGATGTN